MTKPIIVHQENFDTACSVDEGWQRFEHSFAKLFTGLAYYAMKEVSFNAGFPLRIDIDMNKDIWDYCITAKVYGDCATKGEREEISMKHEGKPRVSRFYRTYKPLSVIPASGWQSVYAEYHEDDRRYARIEPLVAFALTETCLMCVYENGDEEATVRNVSILGYVAGPVNIYPAREATNFIGYISSGAKIPNHMREEARKYVEDQWS